MTTETRIETYIPLYRKYRPQQFADLVGQEAISQTLGNAINLNKVAHAYLFCGPRGTGKTSTARIFAKSLNCEQGPTVSPCLQCASCMGISQGNALDVIEFDAASNNGVNDARELIENCQYSSMTGRFKVYIIDEVHMLTNQAFNALLKTLEEPPANVIFIFATTEAHKVLPTIISRCQRFDFNRITTENIVSRLRYIATEESIAIDDEAVLMIARHARGGLRDAVGLLDQVSVLSRAQQDKVVGRKDVALFIGTLEEDLLLRLSKAIAERQAADLLNQLSELLNRGIEPIQLLKDLTIHFRNLLLVQAAGRNADPDLLSLPPDYYQHLSEQVVLFPDAEEIPQIIGRLASVERNVRHSSQPQLWLEVGLIELAYRYEIQLVKDLSERVSQLESRLAGGIAAPAPSVPATRPPASAPPRPQSAVPMQSAPVPSAPPVSAPPIAPAPPPAAVMAPVLSQPANPPIASPAPQGSMAPPAPAGSLEALYGQVCAAIPSLMFRALVQQQSFPISLEGDLFVVGCLGDANLATMKKADKFIHLQKAVDKVLGRPIRVELVLEKKKPEGASVSAMATVTPPTLKEVVAASPVLPTSPTAVVATPVMPKSEAADKPPIPFAPAMPKQFDSAPEKPLDFSAKPSSTPAAPLEVMPPLDFEDDVPPMEDDGIPDEDFDVALPLPSSALPYSGDGEHELKEAKKHAVELMQGRILE